MGAILVAVSVANFSGAVAAISEFGVENPEIIGLRCPAHSIQLIIHDLSKILPLKTVFQGIIPKFVKHFNNID